MTVKSTFSIKSTHVFKCFRLPPLNIVVYSQTNDPQVVQLTSYENLNIYVVTGVLGYPGDINSTFESNGNLAGFANFAQNTEVPIWDTGDNSTEEVSISDVLYGVRGLTLFVPSDQASTQEFSQLSSNTTNLWDVLKNHIINGTTVYSPSLVNGTTYVSAAGEDFHFTSNSSGKFVTSGNVTAQIVQPDVLIKNGVFHIIDRVLLNTDVDQSAADNAFKSASSAAGHSSTETGPVGVPTGGSNGSSKSNSATGKPQGLGASGVVVLCVVLGSSFLFV